MPNQPSPHDADVPLRLPEAEVFRRASAFFRDAGYDERTLSAALSIGSIGELRKMNWDGVEAARLAPVLRWCLGLFVRGGSSPAEDARDLCGEEAFAALLALGLLRPVPAVPDRVESPVSLHPVDGYLVASDRHEDTFTNMPPDDLVFPADDEGTLTFIRLMPAASGGESLDLGGGSGVGALHMARTAEHATTSDITARAARFAAFNARLNGVEIESVTGDLYAPVAGRQFDVITFHPPFLPRVANARVFSSGGATGEELIRRAVEGLPEFLRQGGTCFIFSAGQDTDAALFEQRVREWLQLSAQSFDIIFAMERIVPVGDAIEAFRERAKLTEAEALDLVERLRSARTRQFAYGALVLRRSEDPDEVIADAPLRVNLAPDTVPADFERLFVWRRRRRAPDFEKWLSGARPRLAPELEVAVDEVVQNDRVVSRHTFSMTHHFRAALRLDPFVVPLIRRLNGRVTVAHAFTIALASKELPAGFSLQPLLDLVEKMIERGMLIL